MQLSELSGKQILFLTSSIPAAPTNGSEVASQTIVDVLRDLGLKVTVVGYQRPGERQPPGPDYVSAGSRKIETKGAGVIVSAWFLWSALKGVPYTLAKYMGLAYKDAVRKEIAKGLADAVLVDHAQLGWTLPLIPRHVPVILIAHNVECEIYARRARETASVVGRLAYGRESRLLRRVERLCAQRCSAIWALTEADKEQFLRDTSAKHVCVMPLPPASLDGADGERVDRFDVGLIGSWAWKENSDGLLWFLNEVVPMLRPDTRIGVVGKNAESLLSDYPRIKYLGFVDDATAFIRSCRAIAVPVLSGSGIAIKTITAVGCGTPVVATPIGVRGLTDMPGSVKVAMSPAEMASELQRASEHPPDGEVRVLATAWARSRRKMLVSRIAWSLSRVCSGDSPKRNPAIELAETYVDTAP
jgi:glycosyltransferase involved in cell wall biosynthesis